MRSFSDTITTLVILAIILWSFGNFIKFFIYAYQWITCDPHVG